MLVADVFKVYLYADPLVALTDYDLSLAEDITSGILNVDIQYGTDIYEGPQQQIDTGQFTIVSRNPNLDPKINANLKYNSAIKFYDERTGEFFRGFVTNIEVQYQRKDDPIITITGTDIFGAMQRVVVDQNTHDQIMALSTGPEWNGITLSEFIPYMLDFTSKYLDLDAIVPANYPQPGGFWFSATSSFGELSVANLNYSPAKYIPQVGESYLEVLNKYAQTNMTSFSANSGFGSPKNFDYIGVSSFPKYDPAYWPPQQDPMLEYTTYDFSSDPADARPYESILIDNGYNRVINQADISNEYRYVDSGELKSVSQSFTRTSENSIEEYAISRASISTIYPEDASTSIADWADGYSKNIFQVTQYPGQEIQQITFNNARLEDIENDFSYSDYPLNRIIRIKHQVSDNETIDRVYDIAGISHNISPNKWEMAFTLKPNGQEVVFNYQGSLPILTMNATSGDANFNFTATIGSIDPADVTSITWALSASEENEIAYIFPYARSGNMFKNSVPRTGFTQTWNFDDDGILAPYSFDPDSEYQDPTDNRYGGYGPGNWHVYAFILLTNGFSIVLQQPLTVGTPVVQANFGWVQNLTNNFGQVTFTNTSTNNETGEPDSYAWTFGDGTTSSLQNPVHTYNPAPGTTTYSVGLTVFAYGPGGAKVYNTHTETVTLVQPTMTPDFTFTQNNQTVTFTNTSTNVGFEEPDAYFWEFGDGTTSTLKNPVHTFPIDETLTVSYSVKLTTRNIWEQTSYVIKTVTVTGLNESGTLPGNQIKLRIDNYVIPRDPSTSIFNNMYPYFFDFKARTSGTQANLAYLRPTTRTNTNNITWYEADGTTAEAGDLLNLTRDSSITPTDQFGLTPYLSVPAGSGNVTANFELITTLAEPIAFVKDMLLTFRDVGTINNISYPLSSSGKTTINVDMPDSFGGWVNVGFIPLTGTGRVIDNAVPAGAVTQATKTFVPLRPMPMNVPYFKYTFDNRTATFTSMETADSYAWNFGDGTTSTLKNPIKTFPARGTYTVSLAVTNGGLVTRTTTEPVIVEAINPFDVRYVKFAQNYHDGTHAFDTPYVSNFIPLKRNMGQAPEVGTPLNVAKAETYSMNYIRGTGEYANIINPIVSPYNADIGFRAQSLDAQHRTGWEIVVDYKAPMKNITDYNVELYIPTQYEQPPTVAAGINYSVFVTNYTGEPAGLGAATWTKIGDITPTDLSATVPKIYSVVPS